MYSDKTEILGDEYLSGAGGSQSYRTNPSATVEAEVKALKVILDSVIAAKTPNDDMTVFRIDYKGITWGDRGFHFPR